MTTTVLTGIRKSMVYNLGTIVKGATIAKPDGSLYTYKRTLRDVCDTPKSAENFKDFPGVNIFFGQDTCANGRGAILQVVGTNRQILENEIQVQIDVWGVDNDPNLFYEEVLSDLQALFGNNYQLVDGSGIPWAYTCLYESSERFALTGSRPNVAMSANFGIHYRMRREDPEARI